MTALLQGEKAQERPEMVEGPRLFDDLGLVALPTAVSCARMFVLRTLSKWNASAFVQADAVVVAGELMALAVKETGVADDVRWSELEHLNRIVVRLLGFAGFVVVEVWDASTQPATLPPEDPAHPPTGLHLVDITASRWGSTAGPKGRLMWAEIPVYARTESGLPIRPGSRPPGVAQPDAADLEFLRRMLEGLKGL